MGVHSCWEYILHQKPQKMGKNQGFRCFHWESSPDSEIPKCAKYKGPKNLQVVLEILVVSKKINKKSASIKSQIGHPLSFNKQWWYRQLCMLMILLHPNVYQVFKDGSCFDINPKPTWKWTRHVSMASVYVAAVPAATLPSWPILFLMKLELWLP